MSPQRRIRGVYRKALSIENAAVRAQLKLLADMRKTLILEMVDASGYRSFHLSQVLSAIDREIARGKMMAQRGATDATLETYQLGSGLIDVLGGPGRQSFVGLSPELLQAALDVTTDQTRAVWSELGTKLKGAIRRTTIGITDPNEAVQQVAALIRDKKTFASAQARAEAIVRTEVGRTFSMSAFKRMQQSAQRIGPAMKKAWLNAGDHRVRPAHDQAGRDYDSANAIPVDEPFIVDGEELMFPKDPRGSAGNTINCRCVLLPVVSEEAAASAAA